MRVLAAACALVAVLVAACGDDGVPKPARMLPVTEAEANDVAARFVAAAAPCDPARLGLLIDDRHIVRRGVNKARLRADDKRATLKELERKGFDVAAQLCPGLGEDAQFELLRIRQRGAERRPLLRMVSGDAFNYFELELGKATRDGEALVIDMVDLYSGSLMSEVVAEGLDIGMLAAKRGERFDMSDFNTARAGGDWQRVRELLAAMPPTLREARIFRLAALQVAMQLDDPAYVELLTAFERDFPDDSAMLMLVIDGHAARGDMPALLAAIDRLDRAVGGDPYLDLHRAGAYLLEPTAGNLSEAELLARAGTTALPGIADGWWTLAAIQAMRHEHAAVTATLDELRRRFDVDVRLEDLEADEVYEDFLDSPEFEAWWPTTTSP